MKSKLLKCALSFALASALVFCTTLICYTQIDNFASADKFSDYLSTFVDSGIKKHGDLTHDFLDVANLYLEEYNYVMRCNFPGYEKTLTDIPIECFKRLNDGTAVLVPFYGCYYYIKNGVFMLNNGGFDREVEKASFSVPSADFKEAIEEANTNNSPKGKGLWKASYRTDSFIHTNYAKSNITIWSDKNKTPFSSEVYFVPFYTDENGISYYCDYQFRIYWDDYILGDVTDYGLYVEVFQGLTSGDYISLPDYSGLWFQGYTMSKPYTISIDYPFYYSDSYPYLWVSYYMTESDYYSCKYYTDSYRGSGHAMLRLPQNAGVFHSASGIEFSMYKDFSNFKQKYSDFYYIDSSGSRVSAPERTDIDIGYICSNELISRTYTDVDTSKIPDNYYVTISGDTIYDYSITNPETGQSDTINYYITNNYTLPENGGSGGSGGSGGTVGGDVTVGGQIDVSGNVGVDVNVNINNGDNGGDNIGDYIDASGADVDVGGLLGKLPSLSKGFVDYLKGFFAWLPAEIYGLIILILVISVWNVFRSRR